MNQKATEDKFNLLHQIVTEELLARIQSGEASTQDLKAAIEWLHKNDITGVAVEGNALSKLANIMPEIDPEMVQQRLYGRQNV
jgi:phosphoenolpyruvate carboxylase